MEPRMDDIALLRQTIRRCTAVLVATFAITGMSLQHSSEGGLLPMIVVGSILYLVSESLKVYPTAKRPDDDSSDTPSTDESSSDL